MVMEIFDRATIYILLGVNQDMFTSAKPSMYHYLSMEQGARGSFNKQEEQPLLPTGRPWCQAGDSGLCTQVILASKVFSANSMLPYDTYTNRIAKKRTSDAGGGLLLIVRDSQTESEAMDKVKLSSTKTRKWVYEPATAATVFL